MLDSETVPPSSTAIRQGLRSQQRKLHSARGLFVIEDIMLTIDVGEDSRPGGALWQLVAIEFLWPNMPGHEILHPLLATYHSLGRAFESQPH